MEGWGAVGEGERDRLPPVGVLMGGRTCNLGMCSDWRSNPQSSGVRDDAPTSQPSHPARALVRI